MKRTPINRGTKGLPRVSKKRAAHRASKEGKLALAYAGDVKCLPCAICNAPPPNDAHHCKDTPPAGEPSPYRGTPGSRNHYDAIPLCPHGCHNFGPLSFHVNRKSWRERNGPDYGYIEQTRNRVKEMRESVDY